VNDHDPVAGFFGGGIRQTHNHDDRVAVPGVDLDLDRIRFDAIHRRRTDLGQHAGVMAQTGAKGNPVFLLPRLEGAGRNSSNPSICEDFGRFRI
jgi:hypothetical protein